MTALDPTPDATPDTRNREAWLGEAINKYFRPKFAKLSGNYQIPDPIHVSVGWGRGGKFGTESRKIPGMCISSIRSGDGYPHVLVSPEEHDPEVVLTVLAHQLVHATLDPDMSHGKPFRELATAIGFLSPVTDMEMHPSASNELWRLVSDDGLLGPYPHSPIFVGDFAEEELLGGGHPRRLTSGPTPQKGTRHLRVVCQDHPGGFSVQTSRAAVDQGVAPLCGERGAAGKPCGLRMAPLDG